MKAVTGFKLLYKALLKHDEWSAFTIAERFTKLVYPRYKFSEFGRIYLRDEAFIRTYEHFSGRNNYHALDRRYALDQLTKMVTHIEGDTAECGAYKGDSSYLICRRTAGLQKQHHVFDSFEGLSTPAPQDGTYWSRGDLAIGEEAIHEGLKEFDFVVYHKGWIPEKFHEVEGRKFCMIHLDVDLYQPTLDSLRFFFDRMSPGGLILCDDYGFQTCPGAKEACDSFFSDKLEKVVSLPTGQGFVLKR